MDCGCPLPQVRCHLALQAVDKSAQPEQPLGQLRVPRLRSHHPPPQVRIPPAAQLERQILYAVQPPPAFLNGLLLRLSARQQVLEAMSQDGPQPGGRSSFILRKFLVTANRAGNLLHIRQQQIRATAHGTKEFHTCSRCWGRPHPEEPASNDSLPHSEASLAPVDFRQR